jgi:hypothetical protein
VPRQATLEPLEVAGGPVGSRRWNVTTPRWWPPVAR